MNDLRRELAPLSAAAWQAIEADVKDTLSTFLAARKLVDFRGPLGWEASSVSLGRVEPLDGGPVPEGRLARRRVQALLELSVPFELDREELDAVDRGAADPDLAPAIAAARAIAAAEDRIVFEGLPAADVRGIAADAEHDALHISDDYRAYPETVARATERLRETGVGGPYAIALGPRCYTGLSETTAPGGYPVIRHVERLIAGPVVWAPVLDGALVLSLRGGDFELCVGRDLSIGYLEHDRERVRLHLVESLTFRLLAPEAAVPLRYGG